MSAADLPPAAELRVYDERGRREGSVREDPRTGRLDFYDARGNRVGSGRPNADGGFSIYDSKGRRRLEVAPPSKRGKP